MLYKFGSNLNFKMNGNSVIKWNSATTTAPPPASFSGLPVAPVAALGFALARRRPLRVASLLPWLSYKASHCRRRSSFRCSAFPDVADHLRRALAVEPTSVHRLLLACLAIQLWSPNFAGNPRCEPFFLVAGNFSVVAVPSWPALFGEPLLLLSAPLAPPCSRDAL